MVSWLTDLNSELLFGQYGAFKHNVVHISRYHCKNGQFVSKYIPFYDVALFELK